MQDQWITQTETLKRQIDYCDSEEIKNGVKLIGGLDLSFDPTDDKVGCACLVVLSYPDCNVVYEAFEPVHLLQPYIPGFLAFREADFLVALLEKLRATKPELFPQVVLVDGNGILHQQGCGLACHVGVRAGVSTIGVGKTFFQVDGLVGEDILKEFHARCQTAGSWLPLTGVSGQVYGAVVAAVAGLKKPLFVSIGHGVSLETSLKIVFAVSRYRLPEPIRQADQRSRQFIRDQQPK
jgi:endonuclease V